MVAPTLPTAPAAPAEPQAEVPVLSPDGQLGTIPAENAEAAAGSGYRVITDPAELARLQAEQKFGGAGNAVLAGAAGAARGLTFGASDALATGTGAVAPETLQGLKEAHPIASGVGLVAGAALPVLATAGEATPLEAAQGAEALSGLARAGQGARGFLQAVGALPRATSAAGEAVERAVAGAAGEGLAGRMAATGARGLVEGGLYGAGDAVSESAIEDKPLTAESIIASVGPSALFGGALGAGVEAALGIGKAVLPKGLERAGEALDRLAERAQPREFVPPEAPGALPGPEIPLGPAGAPKPATRPAPAMKPLPDSAGAAREVMRDLGQAHAQTEDALVQLFTEDKPRMVRQLLGDSDAAGPVAEALVLDVNRKLEAVPAKLEAVTRAKEVLDTTARKVAEASTDADRFLALDQGKAKIDRLLKFDRNLSPEANEAIRPVREAVGAWRAALEDTGVWGKAGQYQSDLNSALSRYYQARDGAEKAFFTRAISPEEKEAGRLVVDPKKVQTYLKGLSAGDPGSDRTRQLLASYVANTRDLLQHLSESTFSELPSRVAEARSLRDFLGQFQGKAEQAGAAIAERKATAAANAQAQKEYLRAVEGDQRAHAAAVRQAQADYERVVRDAERQHGRALREQGQAYKEQVRAAKAAFKAEEKARHEPGLLGHFIDEIPLVRTAYHLSRQGEVVAAVARKAAEVSRKISAGIKAGLEGSGGKPARLSTGFLAGVSFGRSSHPGETRHEAFARHAADHADLAADPRAMADRLASATPSLNRHAPTVAGLVQTTAARAQAAMAQAQPRNPVPSSGLPGEPKWQPHPLEVARYERVARAVEHPLSVVEDFAAGQLTPDAVQAMRGVYPELYKQIQSAAAQHLASARGPLPMRTQLQLSTLLGAPVAPAQRIQARLQAVMTAALTRPPEQQPGNPAAAALHEADRAATNLTRSPR